MENIEEILRWYLLSGVNEFCDEKPLNALVQAKADVLSNISNVSKNLSSLTIFILNLIPSLPSLTLRLRKAQIFIKNSLA